MVRVRLFMVEASGRRLGASSEISVSSVWTCAVPGRTPRIHRLLEVPPQRSPPHSSHAYRSGRPGPSDLTGGDPRPTGAAPAGPPPLPPGPESGASRGQPGGAKNSRAMLSGSLKDRPDP